MLVMGLTLFAITLLMRMDEGLKEMAALVGGASIGTLITTAVWSIVSLFTEGGG